MSSEDLNEMPSVTLHRYPAALALPTSDPHALALECMLRFVGAHYTRKDGGLPVSLVARTGGAVDRRVGLAAGLQLIEAATCRDAEVLTPTLEPHAVCVRIVAEMVLLPAFVYMTHQDPGIQRHVIGKVVEPKVASVWQRLRRSYVRHVLDKSGCCGAFKSVEAAVEEVVRGMRALEVVCSANMSRGEKFILGTERPCSVDALAYAAASSFLHADFGDRRVSNAVVAMQQQLRGECPAVLRYVEQLRLMYFEDYSAFYTLRASSCADEGHWMQGAVDEVYARGRWKVLALTGTFSALYFVAANMDVFAELLLQFLEVDGEEDGEDALEGGE